MKISAHLSILAILLACTAGLQAASTIQFTATGYGVAEDAGAVTLTVQRLDDTNTVVGVDYASTNGTATAGLKYTAVSGTLTFAAGETNQAIVVPILNEAFVEGSQTFQVILSNPTGEGVLGLRTNATVRITDNDTGLQFEFGAYSGAEDAGSVLIGVLRGDDGNFPVTVDYAATNGTATAGVDYRDTSGTLTFAPGEKVKLFTVPILNDGLKEANKTFRLTLSNPAGGGVLGSLKTATVTIVDNDPGIQFEFNQYWVQENEATLTVKVLRGNDVDLPLFTVDYATTNLTAIAGQDYTETRGTLTFAAGETVKTITVPIEYDEQQEANKGFRLTLSNPSAGLVLGPNARANVTILDMTGTVAHRFDRIAMLPDQSVQLLLGGGVHKRFKDYFDLYPIEVSTNLVDWTPLTTLQRTNSSTNAFTYTDTQAGTSGMRFYRTVTNHLITAMLKPTGPRPVGMVTRLLTDPTRRNRYGISTNGSFMVSIWYPAVPESGKLPVSFEDPALWHDPGWLGTAFDREPYFVSHALPGAPCATEGGPCPIVLYSPGWTAARYGAAEKAENLASHGYVVASLDHFDATQTVFPDGTYLRGDTSVMSNAGFQDRVRDLLFVLGELARWNDTDPAFAGRLDLTKVAAMGMSWGGGVAGEFGRIDDRVKAVVLLDAYLQNADDLVRLGLSKPFIGMYSTELGGETGLFNKATRDAVRFLISSTGHLNFDDWYWYSYADKVGAGREAARTINVYTLWFLNKYLKGSSDPMPALADYPRVINFKQK